MGDRTTRPPGEAAEFQRKFEGFLKALHPDYERNEFARGIRHEYLREVKPGVFASHHALFWRGVYYHGFCVTLHREFADPYLISPLVIGGRLNFNYSAKLGYFRDVQPSRKWPFGKLNFSDSHSYRKGWEAIVEKCSRIAEEKMLPHYLSKVMSYKKPLLHLMENLLGFGEIPIVIDRGKNFPPSCLFPPHTDYDMQVFVEGYNAAGAQRNEFTFDVIRSKPELFNKICEMKTLPDLLATLRS